MAPAASSSSAATSTSPTAFAATSGSASVSPYAATSTTPSAVAVTSSSASASAYVSLVAFASSSSPIHFHLKFPSPSRLGHYIFFLLFFQFLCHNENIENLQPFHSSAHDPLLSPFELRAPPLFHIHPLPLVFQSPSRSSSFPSCLNRPKRRRCV